MTLTLYELAAKNIQVSFSPYCWKIRMALAHKNLTADFVPLRFNELDTINFSGQSKVPVLVHNENTVSDSWAIANYLEHTFSDSAPLFGASSTLALSKFVNHWADTILAPAIAGLVVTDIYANIAQCDREYFRESREKRFGKTLEAITQHRDVTVHEFRKSLAPLRTTLQSQPFLSGNAPAYADYSVFGHFMWARNISGFELLDKDDSICQWRDTLLDAFEAMARNAPRSPIIGES
jgi:glutathione S-transferase